jgi:hypothetical protein
MRRLGFVALWIALGIAVAGCHATTPQEEVAQVADAYCTCVAPGDDTCVLQIEQAFSGGVPDECASCVYEHEKLCASLIQECTPLCQTQIATPGGLL